MTSAHPELMNKSNIRLQTIKVVGRLGYVNSDPAMPFPMPSVEFGIEELTRAIYLAAIDYYLTTSMEDCRFLAKGLLARFAKESLGARHDIN